MSVLPRQSASLEEQRRREAIKFSLNKKIQTLEKRIGMFKRDLHAITEHIDIIKPHKRYAGVQTEINRLEERKTTLETEIAGLQKDLNKIKNMLERYT